MGAKPSRRNNDLDGRAAAHLVEGLLIVLELECIGDHALDIHLAAIEVSDGAGKAVGLRERANNLSKDALAKIQQ